MLARLQDEQPVENAEIITLAFHVDYWDYLGWKDAFSSAEFSRRQDAYTNALNLNSSYTPQMIVDGKTEFVGSNWNKAVSEIGKSQQKASIEILPNDETLKIKIDELNLEEDSQVLLAITESNLETSVKRGENEGRKLSHSSVVRSFKIVGNINSSNKNFEIETPLLINADWKRKDLKIVVFVQGKKSKTIYALGSKEIA